MDFCFCRCQSGPRIFSHQTDPSFSFSPTNLWFLFLSSDIRLSLPFPPCPYGLSFYPPFDFLFWNGYVAFPGLFAVIPVLPASTFPTCGSVQCHLAEDTEEKRGGLWGAVPRPTRNTFSFYVRAFSPPLRKHFPPFRAFSPSFPRNNTIGGKRGSPEVFSSAVSAFCSFSILVFIFPPREASQSFPVVPRLVTSFAPHLVSAPQPLLYWNAVAFIWNPFRHFQRLLFNS